MINYRLLLSIVAMLLSTLRVAAAVTEDDISARIFKALTEAIANNKRNDRLNQSYQNKYVIEIDLDEEWVEERGNAGVVLKNKRESISQILNKFNSSRQDKLGVYVVVVNDWSMRMKQHVLIDVLPTSVNFSSMAKQAEANQAAEILRVSNELNSVPRDVSYRLQKKGYTDIAVYFGAMIRFYNTFDGKPVERSYKYSNLVLNSKRLLDIKQRIKEKMIRMPEASLEDEIESGVTSLTNGITVALDPMQQVILAYKAANSSVDGWYDKVGNKTTEPFSAVTTDKQVYDYTGVFAENVDKIINVLPDPTAKIIITDNLTSEATIDNIKKLTANALPINVFWFHLDITGKLSTEVFLSQSLRDKYSQAGVSLPGDMLKYIEVLYSQVGPKIRSAADLIDFINVEGHVFKALAYVLDGVMIPKSWWDSSNEDYLLGSYGRYIDPPAASIWAFSCGVWNGIIGNLEMVAGAGVLMTQMKASFYKVMVDSNYRDELFGELDFYYDNLGVLIQLAYSQIQSTLLKEVDYQWKKLTNGDITGVAYLSGVVVVEVIIEVLTAGIVGEVKAGLMSIKLIRVPVEFISKVGNYVISPMATLLKRGCSMVFDGSRYIIETGSTVLFKINLATKEIMLTALETLKMTDDIIPLNFENFVLKMESGEPISGAIVLGQKNGSPVIGRLIDGLGNSIDLDKLALDIKGNGLWKNIDINVIKDYLAKANVDPSKSIKLLDDLAGVVKDLTDDQRTSLLKDLSTGGDFFAKIAENPKLVGAWEVLNLDATLRKSADDLGKLSKFMTETGADKTKLIESFKNTPDARKWVDMKMPQTELDNIYNGFKNDPPFDLDPWTPQHKAQRWEQYKARILEEGKGSETFEMWSNRYDGNIEKANFATKATDDYFNSLKLDCLLPPCREVSLFVNGKTRRLDIADRSTGKAVEFKKYSEGKVYKSKDIENEVNLDKALLEQGSMAEIEWVFKGCEPSGPLRQLLESGSYPIKIKVIP